MDRVVFSGIKPSGSLHLGNYIGAVGRWAKDQDNGLNIFCIVDMHAITVDQDPEELRNRTLELAGLLIASGIDPTKSILFLQSQNLDHANLGWIMNCNVSMGQMSRMTQYKQILFLRDKEKSEGKDSVSVGLFDYPALMAADILLYNTTHVPVGADQKQHVELTRDIAQRFNNKYEETFVLPMPAILEEGARIMSLSKPTKKMSKSDDDSKGSIFILDSADEIKKKIMGATTDGVGEVKKGDPQEKAGINNLLEIYSQLSHKSVEEIEQQYEGKGYGEFKADLAEVVIGSLTPIAKKYNELVNEGRIEKILEEGVSRAKEISGQKLGEVYAKVGFLN